MKIVLTAQKIKFSSEDFFSKCDQIRSKLRIWSHLLKKSLMENFIFCVVFAFSCQMFSPNRHHKFLCLIGSYLRLRTLRD